MKTSVSSYSFGGYMAEDKLGYLGIIDKAAELGFDGIEFVDGAYTAVEGSAERIKERAREKGIEIVAFCTGADFLNASSPEEEIARLKNRLDYAKSIGAPLMRHDISGGVKGKKHSRGYVFP